MWHQAGLVHMYFWLPVNPKIKPVYISTSSFCWKTHKVIKQILTKVMYNFHRKQTNKKVLSKSNIFIGHLLWCKIQLVLPKTALPLKEKH